MIERTSTEDKAGFRLSVVAPVFNEAEVLREFHRRIRQVFADNDYRGEIVFVNDGSTDESIDVLHQLRASDQEITIVDLSRNFGQQLAFTAGIDHASGDAVVLMDADLQDPPELIPRLIEKWREGFDVVYATRTARKSETALIKLSSFAFYRVMQLFGEVHFPRDTGQFRLLSRRAVDAVCKSRERNRYMLHLYSWIGFPQTSVTYERDARFAGKTKWSHWKRWNLAIEAVTSASTAPLKLITYFGMATALIAFVFGVYFVGKTLLYGDPVAGFPTLITVVLFLGGVQLIALGIMGEYLGRTFVETKNRPLYLVKELHPSSLRRETMEQIAHCG